MGQGSVLETDNYNLNKYKPLIFLNCMPLEKITLEKDDVRLHGYTTLTATSNNSPLYHVDFTIELPSGKKVDSAGRYDTGKSAIIDDMFGDTCDSDVTAIEKDVQDTLRKEASELYGFLCRTGKLSLKD